MKKLLYTMSLATLYALAVTAEDAPLLPMNSAATDDLSADSSLSSLAMLVSSDAPDAPEDMSDVLASSDSSDSDPVEAAPVQTNNSSALQIALDSRESIQSKIEALTLQFLQENGIPSDMLQQLMTARAAVQEALEAAFVTAMTANEIAIQSKTLDDATSAMMQQFLDLMSQRATIQAQLQQAVVGALAPQAVAVSDDDTDSDDSDFDDLVAADADDFKDSGSDDDSDDSDESDE